MMTRIMRPARALVYLWTLPTTMVGISFAYLALATGGRVQIHDGILEAHGGFVDTFLQHGTLLEGGASAMTLGHVVLGRTPELLRITRAHERIHVRQCERWGPFFLPAYGIASLWALWRDQDAYRDNPFEREAYGGKSE